MAPKARLAQSAERKALNRVVVGFEPHGGCNVCPRCAANTTIRRHNEPYNLRIATQTTKTTTRRAPSKNNTKHKNSNNNHNNTSKKNKQHSR